MKKNTNLFVSKTRLTVRNLPKREFYEKELKELANLVVEEWIKTLKKNKKKEMRKQKLVI